MTHNVEFFKELNKTDSFNMILNEVSPHNFRIITNDHVFPEFKLNKYFGLTTLMTKIDNDSFNEDKIIRHFNNVSKNQPRLHDNSESGMIFFGIFKDNNEDLYACVTSQVDQSDLIKFYHFRALDETTSNLEVRFKLLEKRDDPSITPETFLTVQQEFADLRKCKLSYLYANRFNYLKSLDDEVQLAMRVNMHILMNACKATQLDPTGATKALNHVTKKEDFVYYFVTELHSSSLVFYNLHEGFGILENNNDTAFLIPTTMFSDELIEDNNLNIEDVQIYESSVLSRKNYNIKRFLTREQILDNITNYAQTLDIPKEDIKEIDRLRPVFLYLV